MSTQYPKGAEWRKWDLHFHTPSSYDYKNNSVTNTDTINILEANNISVAVITDHHIIDVNRIKDLQLLGKPKGITILPGIEFRSELGGSEIIHFIGIFPENSNIVEIWTDIQSTCKLKPSQIASIGEERVYVDLKDTADFIHSLGGLVTVHAGKKTNTIENIKNNHDYKLQIKSDLLKEQIDILEIGNPEVDPKGYKSIVFPSINTELPLVICSDNHDCKNYQLKENCWLKADPTFEGLKQVIIEPEERVFIGNKPPLLDRVSKYRTKYIKELSISQVDGYGNSQGVWFKDVTIPFNSELIAIIGNKGSGKSAIADILSFCSNYIPDNDFSFLTSEKFKKKKLATNFNAAITWESGSHPLLNLGDTPVNTELDVKYLPQGQFEKLTNEISTADNFQKEIESVVFSHIPISERLGAQTFNELIEITTSSVDAQLEIYRSDIKDINKLIIKLEHKATNSYRDEIENKLKKKQEELDALIEPIQVFDPNDDSNKKKQNEAVTKRIDKFKDEILRLESEILNKEFIKKDTLEALQKLKSFKIEVKQKETELSRFITENTDVFSKFEIDINQIISISTNFTDLDALITNKELDLKIIKAKLGEIVLESDDKSLAEELYEKRNNLKIETDKLDAEQKLYHEYLTAKENWKKDCDKITGDSDSFDTLEYFKNELNYLDTNLTPELDKRYDDRRKIVYDIFGKKKEVIDIYKEARNRLNNIIDKHSDTLKDYKITVDASLVKKVDFNTIFLNSVLQNKIGSFHSKDGGEKQLGKILAEIDFDEKEDVITFLKDIIEALRNDKREGQGGSPRDVAEQVNDIPALYNYLFSLEFLDNNYKLKQGDKDLEQLSPGERGALLLVFYLLLDKNDIPLIIDQPEDNLDNHSVATVLVPFMKAAKKNRQIIMVTHNPNLAVVADAEQVIYVDLDKENNYTFSTVSGSIEDKEVNNKIVEVLEGTMPAFNTRKRKYYEQ